MSHLDRLDVAFDGVGGEVGTALLARLRAGGRFVVHGMASGTWTTTEPAAMTARDITVVPLAALGSPTELFELVEEAYRLAATGDVRPLIGQVFPLDQAAEAHAAIEARSAVGKTFLAVGDAAKVGPSAR